MLEYNPIPTNKSQHKEGVQTTFIKRVRNKKYKNDDNLLNYFCGLSPEESKRFNKLIKDSKENKNK